MKALPLFILFFLVWEFALPQDWLWVFPAPSAIFLKMWQIKGVLWSHFTWTLLEMSLGLGIALLVAFPTAFCMYHYKTFRDVFQPFVVFVQAIPVITLAPLMILWFGFGLMAIVAPTSLMLVFPLTVSLYKGLISTPPLFLDLFKSLHATQWATFSKLRLPFALPFFLSGLRIASATAMMCAVCGEWVGGQKGLGVFMLEAKRAYDLPTAFSALFVIVFSSLFFYGLTAWVERKV